MWDGVANKEVTRPNLMVPSVHFKMSRICAQLRCHSKTCKCIKLGALTCMTGNASAMHLLSHFNDRQTLLVCVMILACMMQWMG